MLIDEVLVKIEVIVWADPW